MKRRILFSILFLGTVCTMLAYSSSTTMLPDTIVTVDGDVIICKNLIVGDSEVRYTKAGQTVEYSIAKEYIKHIGSPKPLKSEADIRIVTKAGDVIDCRKTYEDDNIVKYVETGKSVEYALSKSQIDVLVRPNGSIDTFLVDSDGSIKTLSGSATTGIVSVDAKMKWRLYCDGERISGAQYMDMCKAVGMEDIGNLFRRGGKMRGAGFALVGVGAAVTLAGMTALFVGQLDGSVYANRLVVGLSCVGTGIAFFSIGAGVVASGDKKRAKSVEAYNAEVRQRQSYSATLNLGISDTGVGLSINF